MNHTTSTSATNFFDGQPKDVLARRPPECIDGGPHQLPIGQGAIWRCGVCKLAAPAAVQPKGNPYAALDRAAEVARARLEAAKRAQPALAAPAPVENPTSGARWKAPEVASPAPTPPAPALTQTAIAWDRFDDGDGNTDADDDR